MRIPCVTTVSDAILRHRQSTDGKRISFLSIHFMLTPHYSLNCAYEMPCIRTKNYGYELAVMCELRSVDAKNTGDHSHTHLTASTVVRKRFSFIAYAVACRIPNFIIIACLLIRVRFFLPLYSLTCAHLYHDTTTVPSPLRSNVHKHFRHGFMDLNIKRVCVCWRCVCVAARGCNTTLRIERKYIIPLCPEFFRRCCYYIRAHIHRVYTSNANEEEAKRRKKEKEEKRARHTRPVRVNNHNIMRMNE